MKDVMKDTKKDTMKRASVFLPFLLIFLSPFFLTGCGTMNSRFDCPHKPGVMCRSLDQVNDMVDSGVFSKNHSQKIKTPSFYPINSKLGLMGPQKTQGIQNTRKIRKKQDLKKPFRAGEQVMRVWVASYQDTQGNYHNESEIYTTIRKNRWIAPKEINEGKKEERTKEETKEASVNVK